MSAPRDIQSFLPDFCRTAAVAQLLLISQILAILLVLTTPGESLIPGERLVLVSLFLHWITLLSAAQLCYLRRRMNAQPVLRVAGAAFLVLLATCLLVSELSFQLGLLLQWESFRLPGAHWRFLGGNAVLVGVIGLLLLRYLYVIYAWRCEVQALAEARYAALEARIRPHFFFNSLNSVAALISLRPQEAEALLEDLSDLFRAILKSREPWNSLRAEVELAQTYLRIEQLRLGERLRQEWTLPEDLDSPRLPLLCLQPLLENAIYHGIERRPEGGTLHVEIRVVPGELSAVIRNPVGETSGSESGSHLAQENIRQRLRLLYDDRASLVTQLTQGEYRAELRVPL